MDELKILSVNCRGLSDSKKRRDVFQKLKHMKYSIYCLQDTHVDEKLESYISAEWGISGVEICGQSSNQRGIIILFNNTFEYKKHKIKKDSVNGNYIIIELETFGMKFLLVSVYGPNLDCPKFYIDLKESIKQFDTDLIVACGDWNMVLEPNTDTYNYKHINNPKAREELINIQNDLNLVDIWRIFHDAEKKYTWSKNNPTKMARLDFFLISESILNHVVDANILPGYRTDHSMIDITLSVTPHSRGRGYWKFNNSLLKDKNALKVINDNIEYIKEFYALPVYNLEFIKKCPIENLQFRIDDQTFLEMLLLHLRGKIISFSSFKKKKSLELENKLDSDIKIYEDLKTENPSNDDISNKLDMLKQELEILRKNKIEGIMVRSRARFYEMGEKNTSYFLNLENRNYTNKNIQDLKTDEKPSITDQSEILETVKKYYQNLYKKQNLDIQMDIMANTLSDIQLEKLNDTQKQFIEGSISYPELSSVLRKMKNNKSPGLDGFTTEFFKFFWKDLGYFVLRSLNYAYENDKLSITQKQGVITCLPKSDKPRNQIKNWRPISLLNVTYKLASACIAERIKTVLHTLINDDQKGFISGRFIGENTRLMFDILFESKKLNIPGTILLIDFEKAFDTVSWDFLFNILEHYNFGESIQHWVKLLYKDAQSCIIQNGHLSEFFNLHRGCRQGDPLSPYLFLLCAEILGTMIRQNKKIKGITIFDKENKISQYADDTSLFLNGSEESLKEALNVLQLFFKMSGLKINMEKTSAIWIGAKAGSLEKLCNEYNLNWCTGIFTVLGIKFTASLKDIIEINYREKIKEINRLIGIWKSRNLTFYGKITVIKSLLLSKMNHLLISLPDPNENFLKEIERIFFKFIWNKGNDRIKRSIITTTYEKGGLKMVNIFSFIKSLKLTWIRRLFTQKSSWKLFVTHYLDKFQHSFSNMGPSYIKDIIDIIDNPFWKDVFSAWYQFIVNIYEHNTEVIDILNQPIWFNLHLRKLFIREWYEKGIRYLYDLIDANGSFYDFKNIKEIYKVSGTELDYIGLLASIPKSWKVILKEECSYLQRPCQPRPISLLLCQTKGCKKIYPVLNKDYENKNLNCIEKWETILNCNLSVEMVENLFLIPHKVTIETKLREFQFKCLHRIISTRKFLFFAKIVDNPLCSFCGMEIETIQHLFYECSSVQPIWNDVQNFLIASGYSVGVFSRQDILLGMVQEIPLINHLIICSKYYIFKQSILRKQPNFNSLKNFWKFYFKVEKEIGWKSNKLSKFYDKWSFLVKQFE